MMNKMRSRFFRTIGGFLVGMPAGALLAVKYAGVYRSPVAGAISFIAGVLFILYAETFENGKKETY